MSLADLYNVVGSIAGVEELLSREVSLVHELGHTLTMERMQARIFRMETIALAQNVSFSVSLNPLTQSTARIYAVVVTVDTAARIANINLVARDPLNAVEIPIWVWDAVNEDTIRFDDGPGLANQIALRASASYNPLPICMYGIDLDRHVNQFRLRGTTSGFGAGTVTVTALIYAAFTDAPGTLSSRGVPIPSW